MTQSTSRHRSWLSAFVVLLAGAVLAGCAGCTTPAPPPEVIPEEPEPVPVEPEPEPTWRIEGGKLIDPDTGSPIAHIVYFDFDQSIVKPGDLRTLERHAAYLRDNRGHSILIEGHCDERGTREYNLALGERRANAVRSFLMSDGVRESQIETVSYGEERPADAGHDESAWSRNRRAELLYR